MDKMFMILVVALVAIPATEQAPGYQLGIGFYRRMFLGQHFCSTRSVPCCTGKPGSSQPGRDDDCYVTRPSFKGTRCYCDTFCDRTQPDCCPDYHDVCHGRQRCTSYQFECKHQFECIDLRNVCDGRVDCRDGSDEAEEECHEPHEGEITASMSPDTVHIGDYPDYERRGYTEVDFTCKYKLEDHKHKLRLVLSTVPQSAVRYEQQFDAISGEITKRIRISPGITAVDCHAFDRKNKMKFHYRSNIEEKGKNDGGIGLASPDYAKCVKVINTTPYAIVATVNYQDAHGHTKEKVETISAYGHELFQEYLFQEPGASYHTSVPVIGLRVRVVQSGFNEASDPVQVSGVHTCVDRSVVQDPNTGTLYITA